MGSAMYVAPEVVNFRGFQIFNILKICDYIIFRDSGLDHTYDCNICKDGYHI